MIYGWHFGRIWVAHSLSSCQSHNFAFEGICVLATNDDIGLVRSDGVIWSICLRDMCGGIQDWFFGWHLCLLMFSLRREYFSSFCTKVLSAEYRLFEGSFVHNHYTLFWIINLSFVKSHFWEPILSFVPPLAYPITGPCPPNCGAKSCPPIETMSETILYSTGSMLNVIVWVFSAWQAD